MPDEFNYADCQESIQQDLMVMLDGFLWSKPIPIPLNDIKTAACQIVVDNFKKIHFDSPIN